MNPRLLLIMIFQLVVCRTDPVVNNTLLVFDAGSSSTRLHLFQIRVIGFDRQKLLPGDFQLLYAEKLANFQPIASYLDDPESLRQLLKMILQKTTLVLSSIQSSCSSTRIYLRGTAGLRSLPEKASYNLLKEIRLAFHLHTPYTVATDAVQLMTGEKEALYLWISANFLQSTLSSRQAESTYVLMDLGAGSAQIARGLTSAQEDDAKTYRILGVPFQVETRSYENAGREAARIRFFTNDRSVCVPSTGTALTYEFDNKKFALFGAEIADQLRFDVCYKIAKSIILDLEIRPLFTAASRSPLQLHGVSAFYWIIHRIFYLDYDCSTEPTNIQCQSKSHAISIQFIEESAKKYCENLPTLREQMIGFICTDLVYLLALLKDGYGIVGPDDRLLVATELSHKEISWPLGFALQKTYQHVSTVNLSSATMYPLLNSIMCAFATLIIRN
ncbi:Ectonucleoside triphosphate diphosphohydrolase 5 [Cichlidogyrus casuarinus]|uniref:Ectonucleoside triphosphate diphosphohydrolase 5 n=1 Tax=Cichlidogyrus casuarinus TaxID=1844966 RepID=A0ABD2QA73_9PLAT